MTSLIFLALGAAWASPEPCGTLPLLPRLVDEPRWPEGHVPGPPAPDKSTRDAYDVPYSVESENFVVRWGAEGGISEELASSMAGIFETAWAVQIDEMDHPEPATAETYKLNVYLGNSGSGAPEISGAAGYFNTDRQGYPMIVMAPSTFSDLESGKLTAAHELYHAVQWGADAYGYSGVSAWYWEATAVWIEVHVYPDDLDYAAQLHGFAFLPHLALNFFDYPDSGQLRELHQYGAFIFPRYLEEHVGSWQVVRDSWASPTSSDPLESIRDSVEDLGLDLEDVVADFAAHNAFWDYEHGTAYDDHLDEWADYYGDQDNRLAYVAARGGTDGWREVDEALLPERFGYNTILLNKPYDGRLALRFEGDPESSGGRDTDWQVRVVVVAEGLRDYQVVDTTGDVAEHDVGDVSDASAVALVVVPTSNRYVEGEVHGYRFDLYYTEGGNSESGDGDGGLIEFDSGEDARACGCVAAPGAAGSLAGLGVLLLAVVRRRRP